MNTVKYLFWWLLHKFPFFYAILLVLDFLAVLSPHAAELFADALPVINVAAVIALIPLSIIIMLFGEPRQKTCENCGSKIQVVYDLDSGNDASEPDKYEHIFRVTECPRCRNKEVRHMKLEKRVDPQNTDHSIWR
jgi:hypothetical protein